MAMHLLDPTAVPVLPPRLYRNVGNFLTLYAIPALHYEDLPDDEPLDYIYVVDTQKYHGLPGIDRAATIHIFDHHPPKYKFPKHIHFTGEQVGATTTLLTERLRREDIRLKPFEATLLLLGIYEDTGSLTYEATTPRDLQAAAWLLEAGARLSIVRDFLSHSMENGQWTLYNLLRDSAVFHEIEGHSILIATAVVDGPVTSIATVAHQMATLYEPNALLILVQMDEDVQLVARSSFDEINVGEIARHFGGGGHHRAAAAFIYHTPISEVLDGLLDLLPDIVQPSVTVADLMSIGRIETIAHDATIQQAAEMMNISGHEGYPVLDGERVVGLLTRRAVDRAISHHLGHQSAAHIMEAGTGIYVHPHQSLEALRQRMMDTGWGQMPVLDNDMHLIGIVTRTDLIRRWGEGERNNGRRRQRELLQLLEDNLPVGLWNLVKIIAASAQAHHIDLYLVGGLVRDLILRRPNLDIDFVVVGEAIPFVEQLCAQHGGGMRYHTQFGTAKWLLDEELATQMGLAYSDVWPDFIDFATARAEFYKEPTALPTVRQSSIKQDLHRRDFTINSMAIRLSPEPMGDLIDYYNGERDLKHKIIRVLHSLSFVDDPTRMIRAVRFEQRLGFQIEPRTENLLKDALPFLDRVTGERIRNELAHILREPDPLQELHRLQNIGILQQIYPRLHVDQWFTCAYFALLYARQKPIWELESNFDNWYLGIFSLLTIRFTEADLTTVGERLSISRNQMKFLHGVRKQYHFLVNMTPDTTPSDIVVQLESLEPVAWLVLWAAMPTAALRRTMVEFVIRWRHRQTSYDGNQLRALGLRPGPLMGDVLQELRRAWIDGDITDTYEEEQYLKKLIDDAR